MELVAVKDKQDLERLEGIIQKNIGAFYEVGRALMEIRDRHLYLHKNGGDYQTFGAYCKGVWDMSKVHAYRLMDSCKVVEIAKSNQLVTPANEAQARPVAKLEPEKQCEAWAKAVETAPEGKVTAAHVAKVVKEMTAPPKPPTPAPKKMGPLVQPLLVSEDFKVAFDNMVIEIKNARAMKWQKTSHKAAIELMQTLLNLAEL